MIAFVLSGEIAPFTIALVVVAGLLLLELLSLLIGATLSGLIDNALPDFDANVDLDGDGIPDGSFVSGAAQWLHLGDVPLLGLLAIGLTGFGVFGWVLQSFVLQFTGRIGNPWIVGIPAFLLALLAVKAVGGVLARIGIKEHTTAISADSLIGHTAVITLGTTSRSQPSQAKLRDQHGQTHYVLVEPLRDSDQFANGDSVTLIKRDGAKYYVIESSVDALLSLGVDDLPADLPQKAN